jgi:hypothetical protein
MVDERRPAPPERARAVPRRTVLGLLGAGALGAGALPEAAADADLPRPAPTPRHGRTSRVAAPPAAAGLDLCSVALLR